jgi:predicted DNA-binding transcriptional regulator YafY
MPAHATVHVYYLLLERIGKGNGASLKDLKTHLEEHDLHKSERTISRYIEQLRNEFGLDIIYDSAKRNYLIKKDGDFEIENFLNLLTLSQMTSIDLGNPKKWHEIQNVIQFDQIQRPKGLEHITDITSAILKRKVIEFEHYNFYTQKVTAYIIKPLLLKQYQYRWYVIGEIESGDIRTFGLDRLQKLRLESKTFPAMSNKAIRQKFDQVIGLDFSNEIPVNVKISSTPFQANYLKSVPLHKSQIIESESKKEVIFNYQIILNFELIQKILMMADQVQVLEPKELKNQIKHLLNKALKKYK